MEYSVAEVIVNSLHAAEGKVAPGSGAKANLARNWKFYLDIYIAMRKDLIHRWWDSPYHLLTAGSRLNKSSLGDNTTYPALNAT